MTLALAYDNFISRIGEDMVSANLLNSALYPMQLKFILARELGYQFLGLKERANTSAPVAVKTVNEL